MHKISEIRFKVLQDSALIDPERQTHIAVTGHREHVWALGLGPCGREVGELSYEITVAALTIRQVSYPKGHDEVMRDVLRDLSAPHAVRSGPAALERRAAYERLHEDVRKERFVYPLETIVGRIKVLES